MVLCLKVAICAHAAGICVCATSLDILVLHAWARTHKIFSGIDTKLLCKTVGLYRVHTHFYLDLTAQK